MSCSVVLCYFCNVISSTNLCIFPGNLSKKESFFSVKKMCRSPFFSHQNILPVFFIGIKKYDEPGTCKESIRSW